MRKLIIALAALLACAGPALAITTAQKAAVLSGVGRPQRPAVTAQSTTRFGVDNGGMYDAGAASSLVVNNYLTVPGSSATACNNGVAPTPFGLPCTGTSTAVAQTDWWQGVSFVSPTNIPIGASFGQMIGGSGGANAAGGGCSGGADKCIGIKNFSTSASPAYAVLDFVLTAQTDSFWPSACGAFPQVNVLPGRRYTLFYGTSGGTPAVALVDGVTGQVNLQTCATSLWVSGGFIGAAGSTQTIQHTTPIITIGALPSATTNWKAGWGGSIGPVFALVGTFPASSVLSQIATGQLNLLSNPPAGSTLQAYYSLSDVGTWADSGPNHYGDLTASFTSPATPTVLNASGPPAIAPAAVTIDEKPAAGFTFRIDPATIALNASRQICYSGAPATGTIYRSGTWSSAGGRPSHLTYKLYDSSGNVIATRAVTPLAGGTWTVAVSGIPWGTGYTDSIEWANSPGTSGRFYKSSLPFNVGLAFGMDSQSEGMFQDLVGVTGDALAYSNETASIIEFPPAGYASVADDAGKFPVLLPLSAYNTPGTAANPSGMQGYFLDYTQHRQAAGDGATALLKTAYAESGCPVSIAYFGRNGHSREEYAFDHVRLPNANVASSATYASSGGSLYANANITAGGYSTYLLPGSISVAMTYTGGATVTGSDNGAGVLTFSDGSTGFTNYGFNGLTLDNSSLASALGFANSSSNSNNGATYWWSNVCRPTASSSSCPGGAAGSVKGSVSFASASAVIGSGGAVTHVCIDQPNIPDALPNFCTNGNGTGSLSSQEITVTLGTTTIGQLISAINALPSASLVTAQLSGGASGNFELVPNAAQSDIVITPKSTCDATCQAGIQTAWTSDIETNGQNSGYRGEKQTSGAASQIPDGYGVFGDGVNCNSGAVSAMLCKINAPFSAYIEVIGASDTNPTYSYFQGVETALWANYAKATNADPNTPVDIIGYHRTMVNTMATSDWSVYTNTRSVTQQLGDEGGRYYYGGDAGLYDPVGEFGPHPSWLPGGGWLWGQGVGESWIDAVTENHATTYSAGGSWTSAAFTTQTTFGALSFPQCATSDACILVTATLGTGDTAITTAGGQTASSGSGPSTCPTYPATVTDGDITAICLGAVSARANSTAVTAGQILQGSPSDMTAYANGFLYQATVTGTTAASNPILGLGTNSNYVGNASALTHGGFVDGSTDLAYLGFAIPYSNSLQLWEGMTFTNGGNAYMVVGSNVANPIGRPCMDFYVQDPNYLAERPIGADGWDPQNLSFDGQISGGALFTCTIVSSNQVLLARTSGSFTSGQTSILYNAGYPSQRYATTVSPGAQPSDQQNMGEMLTGNRGFEGLPNQTHQGVPIQPLLSAMTVTGP